MKDFPLSPRFFVFFLAAYACLGFASVASAISKNTLLIGQWVNLPDVQLRLLLDREQSSQLRGGVEIRLAPGYKTYWKNPGDSGVPPRFDFSQSKGMGAITPLYPLPAAYDDKAGGVMIGYQGDVIFPFIAEPLQNEALSLSLKLDFAICNLLCIPLSAELLLNPLKVQLEEGDKLDAALRAVPIVEDKTPQDVTLKRVSEGGNPQWQIDLPFAGALEIFSAFPEAAQFVAVERITPLSPHQLRILLVGQAPRGGKAQFNPARLTFGDNGHARDIPLDLDGAAVLP